MERGIPPPVHITASTRASSLLCDSNNNDNNSDKRTGKLCDDLERQIAQPPLSIWSSHADPVWSAPNDLSLFSQTATDVPRTATLLNRQPSNPDSSYDSDDADSDLLTKIVSDIVDSTESPHNDPQLCVQSVSIAAILLANSKQTAGHEEVNRTHSDTLIQEYPEWNIPNFKELKLLESTAKTTIDPDDFDKISFVSTDTEKPLVQSPKPKSKDPLVVKPINPREIYDLEKAKLYEEKLKFAKKLGYTEDMVAIAIANVGYHVSKNDFLNELICIGNNEVVKDKEKDDLGVCQPHEAIRQHDSTFTSISKSPDPAPQCSNLRPIVIDGSNVAIRFAYFLSLKLFDF